MKKLANVIIVIVLAVLLMSCAQSTHSPNYEQTYLYGFFGGLWHGICVPMSFIGRMLPDSNVAIYAVNNVGRLYDFGFCLGLAFLFGAGSYVNHEIRRSWER